MITVRIWAAVIDVSRMILGILRLAKTKIAG